MKLFHSGALVQHRWQFVHIQDGYYKISFIQTGLVLTATVDENNAVQIIQQAYDATNTQQLWKLELSSRGSYIFRTKYAINNNQNWCLSTDGICGTAETYTDDPNQRDEWLLNVGRVASNVARITQDQTQWCWVAAAGMFARHYYPAIDSTQAEIVQELRGNTDNEPGTMIDSNDAISLFIDQDGFPEIATKIKEHQIYSERNVARFIEDGHVLYISLFTQRTETTDSPTGHIILLYGYEITSTGYIFLVHDPWPSSTLQSIRYEDLFCFEFENGDVRYWRSTLVFATTYADQALPNYPNQMSN